MAPTLGDPADAWRYRQTVVPFRVNQGRQIFLRDPNNVEIELNFEVAIEAS
jgi:hypothetical protein